MRKVGKGLPAEILLKLEFFNPLSSVKDRIGLNMVENAQSRGLLKEGMEVLEPTSGNTGIALAFVCSAKGIPITVIMPETVSAERKTLLLLLGARIVITPGAKGMRGAIGKAIQMNEENPEKYFYARQFENESNPEIHRKTTGPEIWEDTQGQVDFVVSGVGTGGTITGAGEFLKSKKPGVKMIAVEPAESPVLSGGKPGPHKIQGLGAGFVPRILKKDIIDEVIKVSTEDSIRMSREIIKTEGIPVGISSGAAVFAALEVARRPENTGRQIVVIVPSGSERYLSTALADEERKEAHEIQVTEVDDKWLQKVDEF